SLLHPVSVTPIHGTAYLTKWHAQLLIITVPQFKDALAPLVRYHRAHGMSVKVSYVGDIYNRYNGGVMDASAIQTYIAQAQQTLGTKYVLLVGADTYDYHNYLGCPRSRLCGSTHTDPKSHTPTFTPSWNPANTSLVPSLYTRDDYYGEIPSDEQYVDRSSGPTTAIGRIPAITSGDVKMAVAKTLAYLQSPNSSMQAVFAAGGGDPTFQQGSDDLAALLPAVYHVARADEGAANASGARKALLQGIKSNATLVDYVGHGNLEQWGQPPALLTKSLAGQLGNTKPALFLGWGCQTAYHVDPTDRSLNATLLFARGGATLTLGSTGLDLADDQITLAKQFFHELLTDPGVSTVGDALRVAEGAALQQDPAARQPVASYEIFGDPTLPVAPLRSP
ncbi:MAG: C25 family cysteine peptidase, partial [Chloroflexota bacterium]|nr:C25 family cysteine peptidase [Chloroflexota bacterium]